VTEQLFHHVWLCGHDAADPARLTGLQSFLQDHMTQRGQPWPGAEGPEVKARLRSNTDAALAAGLFGVPTLVSGGKTFWGLDALPMLRAWLDGDDRFGQGWWEEAAHLPVGVARKT